MDKTDKGEGMAHHVEARRLGRRLAGVVALAALAALILAATGSAGSTSGPTIRTPLEPAAAPDYTLRFEGTNVWFVELASAPAVKGTSMARLNSEKQAFRQAATDAGVSYQERFAFSKLWNGLSVEADPSELSTISRLPGVKAVYPVGVIRIPKETSLSPDLESALQMTGADVAQSELGLSGEGVKVAVMDTGIDYDHPDLGGDGVERTNSTHFPTARVTTGWDFVGDSYDSNKTDPGYQPVPHPDPYPDDCNGHGTHVSGIVGANGDFAEGGARGVAPGVTFGAYRVFGCDGSTTDDVMIAAMERIADDDMDVLNMSIGDAFNNWPGTPTAVAADNLVDQGVVVVVSIGNSGANGIWSAGAPGVGDKVIGVASYDNTHVRAPGFTITPDDRGIPYSAAVGQGEIPAPPAPPTSGDLPLKESPAADAVGTVPADGTGLPTNDGCSAFPAGYFNETAALIRRGGCTFTIKAQNAEAAGAAAVILYNNAAGALTPIVTATPQVAIPVVMIQRADGQEIHNRLVSSPVTMTWREEVTAVNPTGGLISRFSSYGMTADLKLKPDIGAPGGLIRSTFPLEQGGYATISGTSMSSPHVAGAAALLLEAKGWTHPTPTQAAAVRGLLQNTAEPAPWSGNPGLGLLDSTFRQGAGMVQIDKAAEADVSVVPGKISAGEVTGSPFVQTLTLRNDSDSPVTYDVSDEEAVGTAFTFVPGFLTLDEDLTVGLSSPSVTVRAHGTASVDVSIEAVDEGAAFRILYGGYVIFKPTAGSTQTLRVPYAGYAGDYQQIQVLTGAGASSCGGTNEVQRVAISGSPTGGTFTLGFTPPGGSTAETTGPIAYDADATAVRTALAALPSIGSTANVGTGGGALPGTAVTVTFQGTLGCRNIPELTADGGALTGGTSPTVGVTTTTGGATPFPKLGKRDGFSSETNLTPTFTYPEVGTITYTMAKSRLLGRQIADIPWVSAHFDHQARWLRMTVLDAAGNPVVSSSPAQTLDPTVMTLDFLPRNSTAGAVSSFAWDGRLTATLKNGKTIMKNMPNGDYKLRLEVLRPLGADPGDVETYTSPTFTIARP